MIKHRGHRPGMIIGESAFALVVSGAIVTAQWACWPVLWSESKIEAQLLLTTPVGMSVEQVEDVLRASGFEPHEISEAPDLTLAILRTRISPAWQRSRMGMTVAAKWKFDREGKLAQIKVERSFALP